MTTLEFQICSDIHLEYCDKKQTPETIKFEDIISPAYPNSILILAGDIGHVSNPIWQAFMKYVSANWQHVIYVLGNHEYYSNSKDMTKLLNAYTTHLEQYANIHLLNRNKLKIGDYDILGVTMWTHNEYAIVTQINDFKQIKMHNEVGHLKPINLTQYNELHTQDKTWLFANIDPSRKTLVITHFPLTRDGVNHPKYAEQKSSIPLTHNSRSHHSTSGAMDLELCVTPVALHCVISPVQTVCNYYANEFHHALLDIYKPSPANQLICIAGHTHFNYDFVKDNIRYISNCYCD